MASPGGLENRERGVAGTWPGGCPPATRLPPPWPHLQGPPEDRVRGVLRWLGPSQSSPRKLAWPGCRPLCPLRQALPFQPQIISHQPCRSERAGRPSHTGGAQVAREGSPGLPPEKRPHPCPVSYLVSCLGPHSLPMGPGCRRAEGGQAHPPKHQRCRHPRGPMAAQPSPRANAKEKGAMRCRARRAVGKRRPGQWGQEPPTVRTRPGGHRGRGAGESWGAPGQTARPAHCAERRVQARAPWDLQRDAPARPPGGGLLPQGCAHQKPRHLLPDTARLAGCPLLGALQTHPCPPDCISRNVTLQCREYLVPNAPG